MSDSRTIKFTKIMGVRLKSMFDSLSEHVKDWEEVFRNDVFSDNLKNREWRALDI